MESSDRRLYYTPQKEWGLKADGNEFGCKIIDITPVGSIRDVFKCHGRHVSALFNSGLIEVDRDIKGLSSRVVIFKLAVKKNELRQLRTQALFGGVERVKKTNLEELARSYQMTLGYDFSRRLFTLTPVNKNAVRANAAYYLFTTIDNKPLTAYNNMSMLEWDELFFSKSKEMDLC